LVFILNTIVKLLIGLGNPGNKYKNNRHNVGHHFVDFVITQLTPLRPSTSSGLRGTSESKDLIVKTDCFMNLSGEFVKKLLRKHQNISLGELYVAHDDLDIPLGKFKIDKGTGPKLHNGIKSIEETIKSKDFWRIRIGVDARKPDTWIDGEKYVLSDFTREEKTIINKVFEEICLKFEIRI